MNRTSQKKKLFVSYMITSTMIFLVSAIMQASGPFNGGVQAVVGSSTAMMAAIQLTVVLVLNLFLHAMFYYGGFNSSPITKGVGIGAALGFFYCMFGLFVFQPHSIDSTPISEVITTLSGNVAEYTLGGILTAVISVSDVHKWGVMRAF